MPVQTSEEDMEDKESKQNKFLYQGKTRKTDPWATWDVSPTKAEAQVNGNSSNVWKQSPNKGLDLDSVWSVKKNVPLPPNKQQNNKNKAATKQQSGTSYYSRHVSGLVGTHSSQDEKSHNTRTNDIGHDNRSWNFKKPGYSYGSSGGSATKRPADGNDNEFDHFEIKRKTAGDGLQNTGSQQVQHVFITNKGSGPLGSVVAPERKASARTQRAQKMHAAYLKSAGLGDFTPEKSQYQREEKPSGVSWNKKHEDDDRAF